MNDAVMGGGSSFLTRRAFKKVLKLHTWELLGTKKAKPVFNNICWMIQSMQTAVGYRFLLGEYFPLFLALPAPIDVLSDLESPVYLSGRHSLLHISGLESSDVPPAE